MTTPPNPGMPEPQLEWAVDVVWRDWKKAGTKQPTSQFGPFRTQEQRDSFIDLQRRDRDVLAVRVLTRYAAYTPWSPVSEPREFTDEEREAALVAHWEQIMGQHAPTQQTPAGDAAKESPDDDRD